MVCDSTAFYVLLPRDVNDHVVDHNPVVDFLGENDRLTDYVTGYVRYKSFTARTLQCDYSGRSRENVVLQDSSGRPRR